MALKDFDLGMPFPDIFPKVWKSEFPTSGVRFMQFRNLEHFKHEVSLITQDNDTQCGVTYAQALDDLIMGRTDLPEEEQMSIRGLVRSNLYKRGLITQEIYENFKYTVDGTTVDWDVGKYAAGEPDCVITPAKQYIDFFYELYISVSYPYHVSDSTVRRNVAKLLATIEELERQHIFIKITLVFPDKDAGFRTETPHFFATIPLFSHKEPKSVSTMSSVINERLLRKFFFAILENTFKENLTDYYGHAVNLPTAMGIGNEFDEVEFFEKIVNTVGA